MNTPPFVKKIFHKFTFFRRIRLTHIAVLVYGTIALAIFAIAIFGWDAYLFIQSLSPPEPAEIQESKKISLTSEDIDEAIRIIDQRQQQFTTLLQEATTSAAISF